MQLDNVALAAFTRGSICAEAGEGPGKDYSIRMAQQMQAGAGASRVQSKGDEAPETGGARSCGTVSALVRSLGFVLSG